MLVKNAKDIALLVQKERVKQGLTQKQLAGLCNTSRSFIIAVESGKETAQIGKVFKVMNILGLDIKID